MIGSQKIWLNREQLPVPETDAIMAIDHGLVAGDSAFEALKVSRAGRLPWPTPPNTMRAKASPKARAAISSSSPTRDVQAVTRWDDVTFGHGVVAKRAAEVFELGWIGNFDPHTRNTTAGRVHVMLSARCVLIVVRSASLRASTHRVSSRRWSGRRRSVRSWLC